MPSGVQVLLPGLFDLPLEELDAAFVRDQLPNLNRILGWSVKRENRDYSIDTMLARALLADGAEGLAMAPAFAEGDEPAQRLMLIEAIHLRADMQGAIALPIPKTPENLDHIDLIINDLKEYFKVDCDIKAIADGGYLMRLRDFDPPRHYPHPLSVLGKNINPFVEQSRQVMPWYRLINEFQMFMHQHALNAERARQSRLPINSLWAWGAGPPPALASRPPWYCDDPLLNRFAQSQGLTVEACSALPRLDSPGDALVIDLRLLQLMKTGDDATLDALLLDIDTHVLGPLLQALKRRPGSLRLRAGYRFDFDLTPGARFRFWRRPGSLQDWRN